MTIRTATARRVTVKRCERERSYVPMLSLIKTLSSES
jgi:hypothetical protein